MLTKLKLALATTAILVGGAAGIAAARPGGGPDRAALKDKFDTNKDGKLDDTEKAAMKQAFEAKHAAKKAEMLAKYDANKDGKLDDTERAAMKADRTAEEFKRLDKNNDGVLSKDEFAAMQHHRQGRMGRGGKHRR